MLFLPGPRQARGVKFAGLLQVLSLLSLSFFYFLLFLSTQKKSFLRLQDFGFVVFKGNSEWTGSGGKKEIESLAFRSG